MAALMGQWVCIEYVQVTFTFLVNLLLDLILPYRGNQYSLLQAVDVRLLPE